MSLILIKAFFTRFFSNRYVWYAIGAGAVVFGLIHWHSVRVDAAVKLNTEQLTAQFVIEKQKTIDDEAARGQAIVANVKEKYDEQLKTIKTDATRMLADHRAGTVSLSVPATCPISTGDNGRVGSNTNGFAPESRAELSDESVRFFVNQAERADRQAAQLNNLIDVIERLKSGAVK